MGSPLNLIREVILLLIGLISWIKGEENYPNNILSNYSLTFLLFKKNLFIYES